MTPLWDILCWGRAIFILRCLLLWPCTLDGRQLGTNISGTVHSELQPMSFRSLPEALLRQDTMSTPSPDSRKLRSGELANRWCRRPHCRCWPIAPISAEGSPTRLWGRSRALGWPGFRT